MRRAALLLALAASFGTAGRAADHSFETIEKGRAVAIEADCVACHTLKGGAPYAGGVALKTPFGTLVAPNITFDRTTGIGGYTEDDLKRALREGIGRGGKHLYPAMPYPAYAGMTDEDISALYAYMTTLEPVTNAVDVNQLPFPFNVRLSLLGWNLINFDGPNPFKPKPDKSAEWNRGAYLVDALGHCGTCHTPKSLIGADKTSEYLMGANLQDWVAPNITNDERRGIGRWSEDDIVAYLKTGTNQFGIAGGPMSEVVVNSTSKMSEADLRAIAIYLKETKPAVASASRSLDLGGAVMKAGGAIYKDSCAACHYDSGEGAQGLFPRLAGNPVVQQDDATTLIRIVLEGSRAGSTDARPTAPAMPALGWRMGDAEVAAVVTYIRNAWGNAAPEVAAGDVAAVRKQANKE